jgi:RNA polymerase-binding transcription factor DksA
MATAKKTTSAPAPAPVARKASVSKSPASSSPAKTPAAKKSAAPSTTGNDDHVEVPTPKGTTKDGIAYTKDFDAKFLKAQRDLLVSERVALVGQADRLEDEANSLIEDGEMGDVQFDDESGEGDTMVVERERDLALSAQARQTVSDIDAALERLADGTYGYSLLSGKPIPRERLEALPWATELVEEKVGGIGRR